MGRYPNSNGRLAIATAIITAVSALIAGPVAALMLSWLTATQQRQKTLDDYARQDEVADRLERAAMASRIRLEEVARLAAETAATQAATAVVTDSKLNVIHTLVNSQLSAALQNELDGLVREVAVIRELIELKRANGKEPTSDSLTILAASDSKIIELRQTLDNRAKETAKAAAAAAAGKTTP